MDSYAHCGEQRQASASAEVVGRRHEQIRSVLQQRTIFWRIDSFGGVSGVDDQFGLLDDGWVVVAGVVGDDEDGVVLAEVVERSAGHVEVVVAAVAHGGEVGVVVGDDGALVAQQFDDGERGRLAQVVDVALVGQAQDQDLRSLDGFGLLVEARRRSAR